MSARKDADLLQFTSLSMLWAPERQWERLAAVRVPAGRIFARLVAPFALIPPLMVLYAVGDHPAIYGVDGQDAAWGPIAVLFYLAELATVWLLGRLLALSGGSGRRRPPPEQTLLVAALAAIPVWMASTVLAVPSVGAFVTAHLLGQVASMRILYRGIKSIFALDSEVEALYLAFATNGPMLAGWVLLLGLLAAAFNL